MVHTSLRVWRDTDNRAKDAKFVQAQDDEIAALRREVQRLRALVTTLEIQAMLAEVV
jgi:cell division protein FtsB